MSLALLLEGQFSQHQVNLCPRTSKSTGDRFFPRRRGISNDISHYHHAHFEAHSANGYLDVFEQVSLRAILFVEKPQQVISNATPKLELR